MVHLPRERSAGPPRTPSGDIDLDAFADWIDVDVVRRLSASRQAIADAVLATPDDEFAAERVRAQLSLIIDRLRELARALRADLRTGASARSIELLADAISAECERARALVAQSTQIVEGTRRPRAASRRAEPAADASPLGPLHW